MSRSEQYEIGFLIFDGFPMACLTSLIEPLRAANEIAQQKAFAWHVVTESGNRVTSSANVRFEADRQLSDHEGLDLLFLLSSPNGQFTDPTSGNGALRNLARHGTHLGGISGGVFPLVRSGVMEGHPVSVHWCYEAAFRAEFPRFDARSEVIVTSQRRHTVSGAAAAFDLALHLIEDHLNGEIAHEVACWFQHPMMRGQGVMQRIPSSLSPDTGDALPDLVERAVAYLGEHIEFPISISDLAGLVGVSTRQIERAFKQATGKSPTHYYRDMRMKAARQMVMYSKDRIVDIAAAVGYSTAAPMVAHYKAAFGMTPSEDRQRINRFRVEDNAPLPSA